LAVLTFHLTFAVWSIQGSALIARLLQNQLAPGREVAGELYAQSKHRCEGRLPAKCCHS